MRRKIISSIYIYYKREANYKDGIFKGRKLTDSAMKKDKQQQTGASVDSAPHVAPVLSFS